MKNFLFLVIFSSVALLGCANKPSENDGGGESFAQCDDVVDRGYLNVLSINLLFSEIKKRDQRLDTIAQFVVETPVDIVLLQEVVGGVLVDTKNSALDLQAKLLAQEHVYELHAAVEVGLPEVLSMANAVLSRCEIDFNMVKQLPRTAELEFQGHEIKLPRNVMMTRIDIPNFGHLNVYNTHLCAKCADNELGSQLDVLLTFIKEAEDFFSGDNPVILGGDFNIDRFRPNNFGAFSERPFYDRIINVNFTDAYAEGRTLDELCVDAEVADTHCTVGVSSLDEDDSARRIDYLFVSKMGNVRESQVVFNTLVDQNQPTVSDHAGVFVSIELP